MAPYLSAARRSLVKALLTKKLGNSIIATAAGCSRRTVQRIRSEKEPNAAPPVERQPVGRPSKITPHMCAALRELVDIWPLWEQGEIQEYFKDKFDVNVSKRSIGRTLRSMNMTRKVSRRIAQQQDPDLRDYYLHRISKYKSWQLIFIDESGCDKSIGNRRYGLAPRGETPVQVCPFTRGSRWNILPAYWQGGVIKRWVYQGSTDTELFDMFIEQLLHHCGSFPEPKSVLVMDNASWHFSPNMMKMCADRGVLVEDLSPYSPDFDPIEEMFSVLKRFIRKRWHKNRDFVRREFKMYLEWCVDVVGNDAKLAEAHFRHARIHVEQPTT
jgi:transposase